MCNFAPPCAKPPRLTVVNSYKFNAENIFRQCSSNFLIFFLIQILFEFSNGFSRFRNQKINPISHKLIFITKFNSPMMYQFVQIKHSKSIRYNDYRKNNCNKNQYEGNFCSVKSCLQIP
jgi:hypothetical protein